jgi:tRNA nucleotidyltransferase (CCA-adding enzyme)
MDELGVLRAVHPKLAVTDRIINTLRAARESLAWYDLLFQRQKVDRWVVYLFALTDYMHTQILDQVMKRFKIPSNNRQKWIEERKEGMIRLGQLRRKIKAAGCLPSCVYEKLSPLHLNTLIFMMAKADSIETKKALSAFNSG